MCVCYIFNLLTVIELIADKKHNGKKMVVTVDKYKKKNEAETKTPQKEKISKKKW